MKSEVYVAATEPAYARFPYDADDPMALALARLWSAWGRDPKDPFQEWIGPGGTVVIKPNWVMESNPLGHSIESLVTHTSLIRHAIDWCAAAMNGAGTIVVGDAPLQACDFAALLRLNRMTELTEQLGARYPDLKIEVQDWRRTVLDRQGPAGGAVVGPQIHRDASAAQVVESECVDLGRTSFLEEIADYAQNFRVTMYKPSLMLEHHQPGKHEYLVVKAVRDADLLINLPKMKTHIKTGLSAALKNLVGINALKEYLPHHIRGAYVEGGDGYWPNNVFTRWADRWYDDWWEGYGEMSVARRKMYAVVHHLLRGAAAGLGASRIAAGSWSGNETLWRTILDLNHLVYFGRQRPGHVITIVDGVIAGEGQGPLCPSPKPAGVLIAGENPASIDAVVARLMGYNLARVPLVYHALTHRNSQFAVPDMLDPDVVRVSNDGAAQRPTSDEIPNLNFRKPKYWRRAAVPLPSSRRGAAGQTVKR